MDGDFPAARGYDRTSRMQTIFAGIFILQNRLQTAGGKIQDGISMKQWLLLAMADACPTPRTLTAVGTLMGCSRQNIKQLSAALEAKGFVRLAHGANNSVCIEIAEAARAYMRRMEDRQAEALALLFDGLDDAEVEQLFQAFSKLYGGARRVERYADGLGA